VDGLVELTQQAGRAAATRITFRRFQGRLAASKVMVTDGWAVVAADGVDAPWLAAPAQALRDWLSPTRLQELQADLTADVVFDGTLRSLSPLLDRMAEQYDLIGRTELTARLELDEHGLRVRARLDPTRMHVHAAPYFSKPAGQVALVEFDVSTELGRDEPADTRTVPLHVAQWSIRTRSSQLSGSACIRLRRACGGLAQRLQELQVTADCRFDRLEELARLLPALADAAPTGAMRGKLGIRLRDGRWQILPSSVRLEGVSFTAAGARVELDGPVMFSSDELASDGVWIRLTGYNGIAGGQITGLASEPRGQLCLVAETMDLDRLGRFARRIHQRLPPQWRDQTPQDRRERYRRLLRWLRRWDLRGYLRIGHLWATDPTAGAVLQFEELTSRFRLQDGRLEVPLQASANGGWIRASLAMDLTEPDPRFELRYRVHRVEPFGGPRGSDFRPYVERDFPGLVAAGPITMIDASRQRLLPPPNTPNHPVGQGELIIEGGTVSGRAAPLWMTRIFPGLNMAQFDFVRMHDWFTKHADGRIDHQMIFQGRLYHLYMDGYSTADRRIRYEVGIDLLARLESKYWVDSKQGRIPLFIKQGRIGPDGTLLEETVRYLPVHQVIYKLLYQSNPIRTAYFALRRQLSQGR